MPRAAGAFWNKEGAAVQPANLARGLARAVERHGGKIYEQTRVVDFTEGPNPKLITNRGDVRAKAIVLAGEAYLSALEKLHRQIVPLTSHMVVTEPLSAEQWAQIGWDRREVVGGFGSNAGYLNHTGDGRIAFGAYRAQYPFRSEITDALDRNEPIFEHARQATLDWFPMLQGVRFTHSWGGVFGVPRDHMPVMRYDKRTGVATGRGYTGEGVATANLSGTGARRSHHRDRLGPHPVADDAPRIQSVGAGAAPLARCKIRHERTQANDPSGRTRGPVSRAATPGPTDRQTILGLLRRLPAVVSLVGGAPFA